MIRKIILKNFQIHKKLIWNFHEHFSVIVGDNDRGKSSIIRALNWIFYNSPSGDWMRRTRKKKRLQTTVKIILKNDDVIQRIKGDNVNRYKLNDQDYNNFGYQVPEPIVKALRINCLKVGNIQLYPHVAMQDDPLFLVYESAPVRASVINILTGAELIQKAIKEFSKDKLNINKNIKLYDKEIENFDKSIKKLEYIKDFDKDFEEISKSIIKLENLQKRYDFLEKSQIKIENYKKSIKKADKVLKIDVDKISKDYRVLLLLIKIRQHNKSLNYKIPDIIKIRKLQDELKVLEDRRRKFYGLCDNLMDRHKMIHDCETDIQINREELKDIGEVCPECGKPI